MTIALTDDLTGLPNRRCFQTLLADRMTSGIAQPSRSRLVSSTSTVSSPSTTLMGIRSETRF